MLSDGDPTESMPPDLGPRLTEEGAPEPDTADEPGTSGVDVMFVTSPGYQILKAMEADERRLRTAIDEAHHSRPDISNEDFEILARHASRFGDWDEASRQILEYINAVRPPMPAPPSVTVATPPPSATSSFGPQRRPGAPRLSEGRARDELQRAIAKAREDRARRVWPDSWPASSEIDEWRDRVARGWGRGWPPKWPPARRLERALKLIEVAEHARLTHAEIAAAHDPPTSIRTLRRRLRRFPHLGDLIPPP